MSKPVDVLRNAKALIVQYGWMQMAYGSHGKKYYEFDKGQCFCVTSALYSSVNTWEDYEIALRVVEEILGLKEQIEVQIWNDHKDRTKSDILALFDQAIGVCSVD